MPTIDAVLFDFGQVLSLPPDPGVWQQMQQISGLGEDALHAGYWSQRDDYDEGLLTGDEYWTRIVGADMSSETLRALKAADVALWTRMNAPMMDWVAALHRAGFRTGILSNMPDAMAEGICAQFDWIANFDHAVWSHSLKMKKPQPEIYHAAADGLQLPPERILFVDDKQENTLAAQAVGMQAIVYRDHAGFVSDMHAEGFGYLLAPGTASRV